MADKKISQLPAIAAPIAGTDVLPIVQSSTTKKITVAELVPGLGSFTAPSGNVKGLVWTDGTVLANDATVTDVGYDTSTNTVQAKNLTVALTATITNGNLVIGTSGKGIDFSATPGTGTSELFADYEEGTFTPTITFATPGNLNVVYGGAANQQGRYTKIGNMVYCQIFVGTTTFTHTTASGNLQIGGLPYTVSNGTQEVWSGAISFNGITKVGYTNFVAYALANTTSLQIIGSASGVSLSLVTATDVPSGGTPGFYITVSYRAA